MALELEVVEPRRDNITPDHGMQFGVELEGPIHIDASDCTSPIAAFMAPRGLPWCPRVRPLSTDADAVSPRADKEAAMRIDVPRETLCAFGPGRGEAA